MTESSETPIGQSPASGGRVKRYATAAERAKAYRERQRELVSIAKGSAVAPNVDDDVSERPEAAITTLAHAIGELRRLAELQDHFGTRIEEAVARVGDPARVDAALEATKTHALRQVAEAQSTAAEYRVAAHEARADRAEMASERDAALEDAAAALDRLTETEATAQWLVAEARYFASLDVEAAERARTAAEEARRLAEDARLATERATAEENASIRAECAAAIETAKDEAQEQVRVVEADARQRVDAAEGRARAEVEEIRAAAEERVATAEAATRTASVATTRAETEAETARARVSVVEQELAAARAELTEVRAEARTEARALREEITRERSAAREERERRETAHTEELARVRHDADERVRTLQTALAASQSTLEAATRRQASPRSTKS